MKPHQELFAKNAVELGRKGGSVRSERKRKASIETCAKARAAKQEKMRLEGRLYQVRDFIGGKRSCMAYCKAHKIPRMEIHKA
jgi:hypothetical protein